MLIEMTEEERQKQDEIIFELGTDEILHQCGEECSELAVACNKVCRAIKRTTPLSLQEARSMLVEEAGDVLLLLDYLNLCGFLDFDFAIDSARKKNRRWYGRVTGNG